MSVPLKVTQEIAMNPIVALTGLELECTSLDETIQWYTNLFGLQVWSRNPQRVTFKGIGHEKHQLTFVAGRRNRLTGLRLALNPLDTLDAFSERIASNGISVSRLTETSVAFDDPDGTTITVFKSLNWRPEDIESASDRPIFLSHVVLNSIDPNRLISFYVQTLGFRISDKYERGLLTLLRCNQPQHHCLGISPATYSGINHFAMDCGTIDAVMMGLGRIQRAGGQALWGPGRHGPGGNVFCYFSDPNNFVAEFTCELSSISDMDHWSPKEWARTPENANIWGTGGASQAAVNLMNNNPPL